MRAVRQKCGGVDYEPRLLGKMTCTPASQALIQILALFCWIPSRSSATEMAFELKDNAVQCFYEEVEKDKPCFLKLMVVSGGNYDVDVSLFDPSDHVIYQKQREQYDFVEFTTSESGEYYFCFSNEFSSFTHKLVYFDFTTGYEPPITDIGNTYTALQQLEISLVRVHSALKVVRDYQTHHRLLEAKGRDGAEFLNKRVHYWSLFEALLLVIVGLFQVLVLRWFFTNKRNQI